MKATIPQKPEDDEESDEVPSDLDMSEDGDDGLELAEESDNEDLVSLDGMMEYSGMEWEGVESEEVGKKRKLGDEWKERRKKLRSLPTFASYDEYAKMIDDAPEDDF